MIHVTLQEWIETQKAYLIQNGLIKEVKFKTANQVEITRDGNGYWTHEKLDSAEVDLKTLVNEEINIGEFEEGKKFAGVIVRFEVRAPRARNWQTRTYKLLVVPEAQASTD